MSAARAAKLDAGEGLLSHMVRRPFAGEGGRQYVHGDLVDASGWPNLGPMVHDMYLEPLPNDAVGVYRAQRARAEETLAQLDAEAAKLEKELAAARTEAAAIEGSVEGMRRAASKLADEQRRLLAAQARVQQVSLRLTGISGRPAVTSTEARSSIPWERADVERKLALLDRILGQLEATR